MSGKLILIGVFLVFSLACTTSPNQNEVKRVLSVSELLNNSDTLEGKTVHLTGKVESFENSRSFILDDNSLDEIVIVAGAPIRDVTSSGNLKVGTNVEVTGILRVVTQEATQPDDTQSQLEDGQNEEAKDLYLSEEPVRVTTYLEASTIRIKK